MSKEASMELTYIANILFHMCKFWAEMAWANLNLSGP